MIVGVPIKSTLVYKIIVVINDGKKHALSSDTAGTIKNLQTSRGNTNFVIFTCFGLLMKQIKERTSSYG